MFELETKTYVAGLTGQEVFDFLIDPNDRDYQAWWPGTHLAFHSLTKTPCHVGAVVYMDEYVGRRRLKTQAIVREAVPGKRLVWRFKKLIVLPITLVFEFADDAHGTHITHTLRIGRLSLSRVFDPLWRLYFSRQFARDMDEHVRTEFPLLRDMLHSKAT